ncbi:HNH endonuclease [Streptomyces radiopugnans]|uniref:HNH endonuclease n=1 Tax=Streptomyces radiopugnans TaxID=403935 RepID=A0A1H9EV07_9ACTN|nr:HNH endonuclease [Streptomyces radiopugnans]
MENRPKPPVDVKRKLRQHARFGCCRCGIPIYQYHHIIPYSREQHFRVEDMMLLCPLCHDMASKGALSEAQQREIQANHFNSRRGLTGGMLHVNQEYCAVLAGGVLLAGEGPLLIANEEPLLSLSPGNDGHLRLSATLYDRLGNLIALIDDNERVSGDAAIWDLEAEHRKLVVRSAANQVAMHLSAKGEPAHLRAKFWHSGSLIDLRGVGIRVDGVNAGQEISQGLAFAGMMLKVNTLDQVVEIDSQLKSGFLISEYDPDVRLRKAIAAWQKLKPKST